VKFSRTYRPPDVLADFRRWLEVNGYEIERPCDYEILRVRKGPETYMIYERANSRQSWHPHLYELMRKLETENVL
jgi:hypothetical protein